MLKKIGLGLLIILALIQLIRPDMNRKEGPHPNDIANLYPVPEHVMQTMQAVCYDCHSNNTNYPWYFNIQPLAWWLDHHIEDGKKHLNFSEFGSYDLKKQAHKLEEVAELVGNGEMPLKSYTWAHTEARLNNEEREVIVNWANDLREQINATAGTGGTTMR